MGLFIKGPWVENEPHQGLGSFETEGHAAPHSFSQGQTRLSRSLDWVQELLLGPAGTQPRPEEVWELIGRDGVWEPCILLFRFLESGRCAASWERRALEEILDAPQGHRGSLGGRVEEIFPGPIAPEVWSA